MVSFVRHEIHDVVSLSGATSASLASVTVVTMTGMSGRAGADDPSDTWADDTLASLYARERRALVRFGYLLTGDLAAAEDLVQDAFAAVQPRWDRLADPARALGYIRVTMLNRSRTTFRRATLERLRSPRMLTVTRLHPTMPTCVTRNNAASLPSSPGSPAASGRSSRCATGRT